MEQFARNLRISQKLRKSRALPKPANNVTFAEDPALKTLKYRKP